MAKPSTPAVVLGLSAFHADSSAALIVDGVLVAAAEEERFTRVKHTSTFPVHAIEYCLSHAGLKPSEVSTVALPGTPGGGHVAERLKAAAQAPWLVVGSIKSKLKGSRGLMAAALRHAGLGHAPVHHFEHHLAHMASVRPLANEPMLLVTLDGLGDFVSASFGTSAGFRTRIEERVYFPHSLGFFYAAMTHHLGFTAFGEECKAMGLASFGKPTYLDHMRRLIAPTPGFGFELSRVAFPDAKHDALFGPETDQPEVAKFHDANAIATLTGLAPRRPGELLDQRHYDFAHSLQIRFEEIADHLLAEAKKRVPHKVLGLAGRCAHNGVWVGKIMERHKFEAVHVAPASHDAGLAVGAAALAFGGKVRCQGSHWALLGPNHEEAPAFDPTVDGERREFASDAELQGWLARELDAGKIIGLMHGRMEFGPRALGGRSILCDPRQASMRDRLNLRVKHREHFRPFAAAVMWEHQAHWFENGFFSPSMEAVFPVKPRYRERIAAVVHADGSCQVQSIDRQSQPFLWTLIRAFHERTGVPMLVSTGFNDNEPIVCTPRDAMECFRRTDLDYLVIGRTVCFRAGALMQKAS